MAEGSGASPPWLRRVARLRVALGFASSVAVFVLASPTALTLAAGLPVALAGEAVRVWAAGHLNKSREVTRSGPYRWSAHPLYVGSSLMGVGLAIGAGSVVAAALIAGYLAVTLTAAIKSEEAFLRSRFGAEYERYRSRGDVDRSRRFSWRRAIDNREHRALAGFIVAVLLLVAKATYNGTFWGTAAGAVVRPGG